MSAQKPKVIRLENVPVICPACEKRIGTQITLLIETPPEWTITECKVDLAIHGNHGDCPRVHVSGALHGIHGPPDQTHLTDQGSRVDLWDHRKQRKIL